MLIRTAYIFVVFLFLSPLAAGAQSDPGGYEGLRLSVFDVSIKKQKPDRLTLLLSVANTGRLPVSIGKKGDTRSEDVVIELDTANLPSLLQGHEHALSDAVRREKIELQPGAMLEGLSVEVGLSAWQTPDTTTSSAGCPDLVFDTAYIVQYTEKEMLLRYFVRNTGNAAIQVAGKYDDAALGIRVYFAAGNRITRGAIPAGNTNIQKGRETLDGFLHPAQVLEGEIRISLDKRTRFAPNLVFELDPEQTSKDCNRLNNTFAVKVEF